jgi:hypothetical protein
VSDLRSMRSDRRARSGGHGGHVPRFLRFACRRAAGASSLACPLRCGDAFVLRAAAARSTPKLARVAIHRFTHRSGERAHELVFDHNPLTDGATLRVDGEVVPTKLVRKPFGSVFRYRFGLGGEMLEVRVAPSSLRAFEVTLIRADAPIAASRIGIATIASACGVAGAAAGLCMYLGGVTPVTPSLIIGGVGAVVSTGIVGLVYGRAR